MNDVNVRARLDSGSPGALCEVVHGVTDVNEKRPAIRGGIDPEATDMRSRSAPELLVPPV